MKKLASKNINIDYTRLISIPSYSEKNGSLIVLEENDIVPFSIARVFVVNAEQGARRGEHAHKECTQLLVCLSGSVKVLCDNGNSIKKYQLTPMQDALLIPAGIWGVQEYVSENSSLMALCDQKYNEADYIRNYNEFLEWKRR